MPQHFVFCLFPRFSNLCLANAVEPLRAANTLSGKHLFSWQFTAMEPGMLLSSSDMPFHIDQPLEAMAGHTLVLGAGYDYQSLIKAARLTQLTRLMRDYQAHIGLDTGAWLMAQTGLLDGRAATIHWDELDAFAEAFPEIDVQRAPWVMDSHCITCSGGTTALDLMLELIQRQHGTLLRLDVEGLFQRDMRALPQPQQRFSSRHHLASRAISMMRHTIEHPQPIPQIASRLGVSHKALERCFKEAFATTPQKVYRHLRLSRALHLLRETNMPMTEIAIRCGYGDASSFARAFRSEFGTAPRHA